MNYHLSFAEVSAVVAGTLMYFTLFRSMIIEEEGNRQVFDGLMFLLLCLVACLCWFFDQQMLLMLAPWTVIGRAWTLSSVHGTKN